MPTIRQTIARARNVRTALILAAVAAAVAPIPPTMVGRLYPVGVYSGLQRRLTSVSNQVPFALFDVLLGAIAVAWITLGVRDVRRPGPLGRRLVPVAARTVTWIAGGYLAFLLIWGFNYRRPRLLDTLQFDPARVTSDAVKQTATAVVERLNGLYVAVRASGLPEPGGIDPALAAGLNRALSDIGRTTQVGPARPKRTVLDWYFRRAGVDGMTDPFFLETLLASDVLPFERPFVIAHEWSHLAGVADEGEANFVGWLGCVRASPSAEYSAWLFLYRELVPYLSARDRSTIATRLAPGPRGDLLAIRERYLRQVSPRVSAAGWRLYDSYLKANRVEAGAASYGEVVRLVLGTRLPSGAPPIPLPLP
jgi:hypothetical protein